ncbi:MAG: hypothetical protein ACE5FL_08370 [Myxococcota bacterium]
MIAVRAYRLYLGSMAALAFGLVMAETSRYGVGISPDSVVYVGQARELAACDGILAGVLRMPAFATQPPLFPALLAAIQSVARVDPVASARVLNAVLFALCVLGTGWFVAGRTGAPVHPVVAVAVPLFVLLSRSLHAVFGMAWTEPLFVFWVLLFLVAMACHLERGGSAHLAAAAGCAIAACATRYSGVTLIATGALTILVAPSGPAVRRVRNCAAFAGVTSIAVSLWIVRNLAVLGTPFGERSPAVYGWLENVVAAVGVLQGHLLPSSGEMGVAAKLAVVAAAAGLALWAALPNAARVWTGMAKAWPVLLPCAVFALIFPVFTVVTASSIAFDPVNFRLLSPVYLPVLIVVALLASSAMDAAADSGPRLRIVTVVLLVLAAMQPLRQFATDYRERARDGVGLNHRTWSESPTLAYLAEWFDRPADLPIFSNVPTALEWHLGIDARNGPVNTPCAHLPDVSAAACFEDHVPPEFFDGLLVHFAAQQYPYYYSLEELRRFVDLTPVAEPIDGGIYFVSRRGPPE